MCIRDSYWRWTGLYRGYYLSWRSSSGAGLSSVESTDESSTNIRRITRQRKPPGEWWKVLVASSVPPDYPETSLHAIISGVPQSYSDAMNLENIDFWAPVIKRKEDCIRDNKTFELVERKPWMNVLPSRYVFKIKNNGPKVRIVAKGFRQVQGGTILRCLPLS